MSEEQTTDATSENDDPTFYDRVDAHIEVANQQTTEVDPESVTMSMMYAGARYGAWLAAGAFESGEALKEGGAAFIEGYLEQFKLMLEDTFAEYIENFDQLMTGEPAEEE